MPQFNLLVHACNCKTCVRNGSAVLVTAMVLWILSAKTVLEECVMGLGARDELEPVHVFS